MLKYEYIHPRRDTVKFLTTRGVSRSFPTFFFSPPQLSYYVFSGLRVYLVTGRAKLAVENFLHHLFVFIHFLPDFKGAQWGPTVFFYLPNVFIEYFVREIDWVFSFYFSLFFSLQTSLDLNSTTSVLTFRPTVDDGGKYMSCRGQQNLIPDSGLEDGWKLEIYRKYH